MTQAQELPPRTNTDAEQQAAINAAAVERAAQVYLDRKARRSHPVGVFDTKRWYPIGDETQICCASIRSPSKKFPYALMTHCRSARHVAELFGVDEKEVKRAAKKAWGK